jgi:hypothetical protein
LWVCFASSFSSLCQIHQEGSEWVGGEARNNFLKAHRKIKLFSLCLCPDVCMVTTSLKLALAAAEASGEIFV